MAFVATDLDGEECVFYEKPFRVSDYWEYEYDTYVSLPKGSIKKLIGRELTWSDEPVELKEDIST